MGNKCLYTLYKNLLYLTKLFKPLAEGIWQTQVFNWSLKQSWKGSIGWICEACEHIIIMHYAYMSNAYTFCDSHNTVQLHMSRFYSGAVLCPYYQFPRMLTHRDCQFQTNSRLCTAGPLNSYFILPSVPPIAQLYLPPQLHSNTMCSPWLIEI